MIPHIGTVIVCTVGMSLSVVAAPSLNKVLSPGRPAVAGEGSQSMRSVSVPASAHLDLRLPEHDSMAAAARNGVEHAWLGGASELHGAMNRAGDARAADVENSFRPLGAEIGARPAVRSMVEHFHREGLPVARLWENHSALVSLGLNGKGKPGLWLVQKTH